MMAIGILLILLAVVGFELAPPYPDQNGLNWRDCFSTLPFCVGLVLVVSSLLFKVLPWVWQEMP